MDLIRNRLSRFVFNKLKNLILNVLPNGVSVSYSCILARSKLANNVKLYDNVTIFNSTIGKYTYIQRGSTIGNATIGSFCSIAEGVKIGLGVHPISEFVSTHPFCYGSNRVHHLNLNRRRSFFNKYFPESVPVSIGHDVNIGVNAIVLDGVSIGNGAVIGAGSIVTKNVPPYSVVCGSPAKIIKKRFSDEMILSLEGIKWWDFDEEMLQSDILLFSDVRAFIKKFEAGT